MVMFGMALPAHADECPAIIKEFEAALKTAEANDETKAAASQLIAQAREQEASGQPELCVETVEQALAMLSQ
jgi:ATP/maltotriose-dependent transcriptional regulator MalT